MPHPLAQALHRDVQAMTGAGQALLHPRSAADAMFRKAARWVGRNKADLASTSVQMVAAGLLTGPIGAAAVPAAYALTAIATSIYVWRQNGLAREALGDFLALGAETSVRQGAGGILVVDTRAELAEMMGHVVTLAKNKALDRMVICFDELDIEARALADRISGDQVKVAPATCDDAWRLVEMVERVKGRMAAMSDACDLLFHFVHYAKLLTSSYDDAAGVHAFEPRRQAAINRLIQLSGPSRGEALEEMNRAANSGRVFHNRLRLFSLDDHRLWVQIHNPELTPNAVGTAGSRPIVHAPTGAGATFATTTAIDVAASAGGTGASVGARVAYNAATGTTLTQGVTTASAGVASSLSAVAASGISGGVGVAVDAIVQSLSRYVDLRKLGEIQKRLDEGLAEGSTRRLIDILEFIDYDAVSNLRKHAGEILETAATKVQHLVEADAEFNEKYLVAGKTDLAEILARRQKLQDQVAGLLPLLYTFYECTVGRALAIQNCATRIEASVALAVEHWVTHHPDLPCDAHTGHVCYMDAAKAWPHELRRLKLTNSTPGAPVRWQNQPMHPGPKGEGGLRAQLEKLR